MDCTLDHYLLEGYLDGELGFERTLEVEAHLASCRRCTAEVQSGRDIRGAIQRSDLYDRAPASLEEKLRKLTPQKKNVENEFSRFRPWAWAGGGAAFASAALLLIFFVSRPAIPTAEQELVASHVRSLISSHLMDVISTDQHTVKPWFDGKLDFAPPVRDLAAQGYPLAGGRLDYLEGRTVAVLIYRRALHPINLYAWPAADQGVAATRMKTVQGYNVLSWKKGGFEFRAVSDLNGDELGAFAKLVTP